MPKLEQWFITENDLLIGRIYGHPVIPDGAIVRTGRVVRFDAEHNRVYTARTDYELGTPAEVHDV